MAYIFYYKIVCLLVGLAIIYLGYKLFIKGVFNEAGNFEGSFKSYKVILRKAAPGTYFILLGTAIICFTIWKGLSSDETTLRAKTPTSIKHQDSVLKLNDSINLK